MFRLIWLLMLISVFQGCIPWPGATLALLNLEGDKQNNLILLPALVATGSNQTLPNESNNNSGSNSNGNVDNSGSNDSGNNSGSGGLEKVAKPIFNPSAGDVPTNTTYDLEITTTTPGATIYYTTDGTNPTTSSTQYSTPIKIWILAGKTIKAIAVKSGMTDSDIETGIFHYPPLKTGQTTEYTSGDDGTSKKGMERSYTDNGDSTITDNATGLVWQKCIEGKTGSDCLSGTSNIWTWTDAVTKCSDTYGAGWRLPTRLEIATLVKYEGAPKLDSIFPTSPYDKEYWSSSEFAISPTQAWSYHINTTGYILPKANTTSLYVRCVKGTTKEDIKNFTDNNDGTVKDNITGLVWQKCSYGETYSSGSCSGTPSTATWTAALSYCNGLGGTWRLPNVNELQTIVDYSKTSAPPVNTSIFSGVASNYWTSSSHNLSAARIVYFDNTYGGSVGTLGKTSFAYARCVSGGL